MFLCPSSGIVIAGQHKHTLFIKRCLVSAILATLSKWGNCECGPLLVSLGVSSIGPEASAVFPV